MQIRYQISVITPPRGNPCLRRNAPAAVVYFYFLMVRMLLRCSTLRTSKSRREGRSDGSGERARVGVRDE